MNSDYPLAEKLLEPYNVPAPAHIRVPRIRKAAKRCYELAGKFLLEHPEGRLVHGIVNGDIPHAWVEIDGLVYDGTCKGLFESGGYYAVMNAKPIQVFGHQEFCEKMSNSAVWGPLTD